MFESFVFEPLCTAHWAELFTRRLFRFAKIMTCRGHPNSTQQHQSLRVPLPTPQRQSL